MATAAQHINTYRLEPGQRGAEATAFELVLRRKIVGQDEAVKAVADLYQTSLERLLLTNSVNTAQVH